jgi:hypothetical protein
MELGNNSDDHELVNMRMFISASELTASEVRMRPKLTLASETIQIQSSMCSTFSWHTEVCCLVIINTVH